MFYCHPPSVSRTEREEWFTSPFYWLNVPKQTFPGVSTEKMRRMSGGGVKVMCGRVPFNKSYLVFVFFLPSFTAEEKSDTEGRRPTQLRLSIECALLARVIMMPSSRLRGRTGSFWRGKLSAILSLEFKFNSTHCTLQKRTSIFWIASLLPIPFSFWPLFITNPYSRFRQPNSFIFFLGLGSLWEIVPH